MAIKYDEYLLLELFCSEPIIIDADAEIYSYRIKDKIGFELTLYFSVYDQFATARLEYKGKDRPIFEVELNNVQEIKADKEKLSFFRQDTNEPVFQIMILPSFMLDLNL
ncbi:hypothetical protein OIN60_03360 [Paenibacillus sp. P96]|uniref:Uncharacterized protein n=1 Tax=Paenibacillus zeirhizosphaerae TaxID=2987519 RepID=A0ABT9FM45_9BACL|nr:hypothetical protein [Paenibacillus sp. P96]MDP4095828.1 hypothetical protein [Paenibacillus sp. P96]